MKHMMMIGIVAEGRIQSIVATENRIVGHSRPIPKATFSAVLEEEVRKVESVVPITPMYNEPQQDLWFFLNAVNRWQGKGVQGDE